MCPKRPSIYDIKRNTAGTSPNFFERATLKFFGQRLSDFSVYKQDDGRYLISAPRRICGKFQGYTRRYYNPTTHELTVD